MPQPATHHHHPYAHTLALLRLALRKLPPTFPPASRQQYEAKLAQFEDNPRTPYQAINEVIVRFGKDSWPWRQAYQQLYDQFGRSSEEAHLLKLLGQDLRQKYEKFIHDGGKINHFETARSEARLYAPSSFERYFTPEEKFALQQALIDAREAARQEIDGLVSERRAEQYGQLVDEWLKRQAGIAAKIEKLRELAAVSEKHNAAIRERVRLFEEGWSVVEKGVDEKALDKELEYWKGMLEAFLDSVKI